MQHPAFPRGPPPQYYLGSTLLNCAVRMGSGDPGRMVWLDTCGAFCWLAYEYLVPSHIHRTSHTPTAHPPYEG
eukprot:scaffold64699_cov39-Tisochrysis_lutea.AAC.1